MRADEFVGLVVHDFKSFYPFPGATVVPVANSFQALQQARPEAQDGAGDEAHDVADGEEDAQALEGNLTQKHVTDAAEGVDQPAGVVAEDENVKGIKRTREHKRPGEAMPTVDQALDVDRPVDLPECIARVVPAVERAIPAQDALAV